MYNSVLRFECEDGYELQGASYITCEGRGTWSDEKPTCNGRVFCSVEIFPN